MRKPGTLVTFEGNEVLTKLISAQTAEQNAEIRTAFKKEEECLSFARFDLSNNNNKKNKVFTFIVQNYNLALVPGSLTHSHKQLSEWVTQEHK